MEINLKNKNDISKYIDYSFISFCNKFRVKHCFSLSLSLYH